MDAIPVDEALIGRERERSAFRRAIVAAREGCSEFLLLAGEAGIGKTFLARQCLARSGLLVLYGEAHQDLTPPYGPLTMALRSLKQQVAHDSPLSAAAERPIALILPEGGTTRAIAARATLFEAIRATLAAIAAFQPAALFLDDLQWADSATLEMLPPLASELGRVPLLLVAAYRSDEVPRGHPVRRLRSELRHMGRLNEVELGPLDHEQTTTLLTRSLGTPPSPALALTLHNRAEGVPFLLEELAASLAGSGRLHQGATGLVLAASDDLPLPESVRDAVLLRLGGLSRQARQALDVAAVIGQDFDIDLVTAFTGDEQWVTELLQHELVVEVAPGRAAFRHALTREACYAEVEWPRRRNLHRQLAAHLDATGASPAIVAGHWLAGRDTDRARTALLTAAEEAGRVGAYRDAGRAFGRALDLWPEGTEETERLEALDRMGQCAEMAGNLAEAARIWREVAGALRLRGENRKVAVVERRLAGAYELQGDWERALVARDAAANEFVVENLHGDAAAERLLAAAHLRSAGSFRAALGVLQLAQSEAEQAERWDLQARIIGLEGNLRARLGESEAGLALVRAGLALALEHNLTGPAAELYQRLADSLEHGGNYSGAKEAYGAAFAFCRAQDLPTTAQLCLACLTVVLRQTGEWQQSAILCRDGLAEQEHSPHAHAVAAGTLGAIHALRGQGRRAKPLLIEASAVARRIELAAMELLSTWGLALVDELDGDRDSAIARFTALIERWTMTEDRHYTVPVLHWAVTYCAEQGADAEAHACAAALAQIAASTGQPEALAALAHALGETALLGGDAMGASIQFGQALDLLRNLDLPLERAQVARRAAAALVLVDQREAAIDHLSNAYRLARRLGARPLAARVTHQLTELGEPVERHIGRFAARQHAGGGLSRREAEVLRLVAAGKTSRQIGDSLYLSPRTVEMHVQHILGKLDCYTRAEAVRKATALGLLG